MPTKVFDAFTRLDASDVNAYLANKSISNAVINGAFDIWQRGTSFTVAAGGQVYTADRFGHDRNGTGATVTISRQTFTPGEAPEAGYEGEFFARIAQSVAGSGSTFNNFDTRIEDVRSFAGQTVTFSFWAKASAATTIRSINLSQNFGSGGSAGVNNLTSEIVLSTSWQRYTRTVSVPSVSGKTIGAGSFLRASFSLPLNSTFTIDIWGVQLEPGTVANDFRRNANSLQGELAACQRYYYRQGGERAFEFHGIGAGSSTTLARISVTPKQTMRVAPTSIEFSTLGLYDSNSTVAVTNLTFDQATRNQVLLLATADSGLTAFRPYYLLSNNSLSGFVAFSAEL
jgi:hypothetical protein